MNHPPPMVVLRDVSKHFGAVKAVRHADFTLPKGAFLTILGPSGCGKTTLLRMIAGFDAPTAGEIFINGQAVSAVPPHRRAIGMVFQRLALFPHMTAFENIAYPLKMRRFNPADIPELVARYLAIVRLEGMGNRRISALSGGQQQRVAIARALVFSPDLLLLDEPLSALDKKLREEMQLEFRRIQRELGVTTINVTHDQREALVMSDEIIVMSEGVIQQSGDPVSLYHHPSNPFVAGFIGLTTLIQGTLARAGGERVTVAVGNARLQGHAPDAIPAEGDPVACGVRAEQVRILQTVAAAEGFDNRFHGVVTQQIFEGDRMVYQIRCPDLADTLLLAFDHDPTHHKQYRPEDPVRIAWNARDLFVYPATHPRQS